MTPLPPDPKDDFLRLDKWLFFARFCKSRAIAAQLCASGKLRLSGRIIDKPHYKLRVGDVLTFPQGPYIRVVRVLALAGRRGPASEVQGLYEDLSPPEEQRPIPLERGPQRPRGSGRPTKRDRRQIAELKQEDG